MSKPVSKPEAIKTINSIEPLQILLESIDRNETASSKNSKLNRFLIEIQKQVKEERDVVLLSFKVK